MPPLVELGEPTNPEDVLKPDPPDPYYPSPSRTDPYPPPIDACSALLLICLESRELQIEHRHPELGRLFLCAPCAATFELIVISRHILDDAVGTEYDG